MTWDRPPGPQPSGNPAPGRSLVAYTPAGEKVHLLGPLGKTMCNRKPDMVTYAVIIAGTKCSLCFADEGAPNDRRT